MKRALGLLALLASACSMPHIEGIGRYGNLEADGDVEVQTGPLTSSAGTSELGIDDENIFQPRVDVDWSRLHLSVDVFNVEFDGNGALRNTFTLPNGNNITANTPVSSSWDLGYYTARGWFDLLSMEAVQLGLGAGGGFLDYDAEIQSLTSTAFYRADDSLPFAFLSGRVAAEIDRFRLVGIVEGLGVELDEEDLAYYAVDVFGSFRMFDVASIDANLLAGYRYLYVDYEFKSGGLRNELDADFQGFYGGLSLRF